MKFDLISNQCSKLNSILHLIEWLHIFFVHPYLLHAAYDNAEMQAVTIDHPDYGAAWRQADYDFFTSEDCKRILHDQKIQVVMWREIRDKIVRK